MDFQLLSSFSGALEELEAQPIPKVSAMQGPKHVFSGESGLRFSQRRRDRDEEALGISEKELFRQLEGRSWKLWDVGGRQSGEDEEEAEEEDPLPQGLRPRESGAAAGPRTMAPQEGEVRV